MKGIHSNTAVTVLVTIACGAASLYAAYLAGKFWSADHHAVRAIVLWAISGLCSWRMCYGFLQLWAKTKKTGNAVPRG